MFDISDTQIWDTLLQCIFNDSNYSLIDKKMFVDRYAEMYQTKLKLITSGSSNKRHTVDNMQNVIGASISMNSNAQTDDIDQRCVKISQTISSIFEKLMEEDTNSNGNQCSMCNKSFLSNQSFSTTIHNAWLECKFYLGCSFAPQLVASDIKDQKLVTNKFASFFIKGFESMKFIKNFQTIWENKNNHDTIICWNCVAFSNLSQTHPSKNKEYIAHFKQIMIQFWQIFNLEIIKNVQTKKNFIRLYHKDGANKFNYPYKYINKGDIIQIGDATNTFNKANVLKSTGDAMDTIFLFVDSNSQSQPSISNHSNDKTESDTNHHSDDNSESNHNNNEQSNADNKENHNDDGTDPDDNEEASDNDIQMLNTKK